MHEVRLIYCGPEAQWGAVSPDEIQQRMIRRGEVIAIKRFPFRWMVRAYKRQVSVLSDGNPRLRAFTQDEIERLLALSPTEAAPLNQAIREARP